MVEVAAPQPHILDHLEPIEVVAAALQPVDFAVSEHNGRAVAGQVALDGGRRRGFYVAVWGGGGQGGEGDVAGGDAYDAQGRILFA